MTDGGSASNEAFPSRPVPIASSDAREPIGSSAEATGVGAIGYKRLIGRLHRVEIENYRAFRGRIDVDLPNGCNLLVYGENGAGKSSLFNALADFLESPSRRIYDERTKVNRPLRWDDNRYRYNSDPGFIRLSFSTFSSDPTSTAPLRSYEWSGTRNDPTASEMRTVDRGKGFLDYRALLRAHLLPAGERYLNLFPLFIDPLLAHYINPASSPGGPFAEEWKRIEGAFQPRVWRPASLDEWIRTFNAGFERVAKDTVAIASGLLRDFDKELAIDIDFTPASYTWRPKKLLQPTIVAKPSLRRLQAQDYHTFLNEARLSALAIAIYFAGLKNAPAADLRLLVLDDILIGLDMANRMTVLANTEKLFRDWQVILLTYHKAWFEVLKARTQDGTWSHPWSSVTLRTPRAMGIELPIVVAESGSLLAQAQAHVNSGDAKAAAVYARSAWEQLVSWYCGKWHLCVTYAESRRKLDTNTFLRAIEDHLKTLRRGADREWARGLLVEIRHARRFVLNPNAHYDPELEDEISAEIAGGIRAVEDFETLLRCVKRGDFASKHGSLQVDDVDATVRHALGHLAAGRRCAALSSLSEAFERFLTDVFHRYNVSVPHGANTRRLFLRGTGGYLFPRSTLNLLRHAEPYLLGTVAPDVFDPTAFEFAAGLFMRFRLASLLSKLV